MPNARDDALRKNAIRRTVISIVTFVGISIILSFADLMNGLGADIQ
jgi:hypothetical protein